MSSTERNVICIEPFNVCYGNFLQRSCCFFWQVYSERYVDQMGIIGYFPATLVRETQKFMEDTVKIPTTVSKICDFLQGNIQDALIENDNKIIIIFFCQDTDFYCD